MNLLQVFPVLLLILVEVRCLVVTPKPVPKPPYCHMIQTEKEKVDTVVYINGDTHIDIIWYQKYCAWKKERFPYHSYAPLTVKVGGAITCDQNNNCNCPNFDSKQVDCSLTFQNVCAEKILGQTRYLKLLCCSAQPKELNSDEPKGFSWCVKENDGLEEKINECMKNEGSDSPVKIALKHSQEVIDNGVDLSNNTEPFFFYNQLFDKCISDDSPVHFLDKICAVLKYDIAKNIPQCVKAMWWIPS